MSPQKPFNLRAWRRVVNLSQRAAAEALGVTLATLQRMERGKDWGTDKPVEIDLRTRLACAAIRHNIPPEE